MTERVAFYAPLKPPTHPTPSGDRRFARLLLQALRRAGFDAETVSTLRSRNADGDDVFQDRLERRAAAIAARLIERFRDNPPSIWFTYHLYYKAPDLLGPAVSSALGIPYIVAEASRAAARADGPWRRGHALTDSALRQADLILQPNPRDLPEIQTFLGPDAPIATLPPFVDLTREGGGAATRPRNRADIAARLGLNGALPWLVSTGMMRPGAKRDSYRVIAQTLAALDGIAFHWILIGDGPARPEIEREIAPDPRIRFAGALSARELRRMNTASDLFVWPAIGEAFGMAPLEAQAAGLPVILGDRPGTRVLVDADRSGLLVPEGDAAALARAVRHLLESPESLAEMGKAARAHVARNHDIAGAAALLRTRIDGVLAGSRR